MWYKSIPAFLLFSRCNARAWERANIVLTYTEASEDVILKYGNDLYEAVPKLYPELANATSMLFCHGLVDGQWKTDLGCSSMGKPRNGDLAGSAVKYATSDGLKAIYDIIDKESAKKEQVTIVLAVEDQLPPYTVNYKDYVESLDNMLQHDIRMVMLVQKGSPVADAWKSMVQQMGNLGLSLYVHELDHWGDDIQIGDFMQGLVTLKDKFDGESSKEYIKSLINNASSSKFEIAFLVDNTWTMGMQNVRNIGSTITRVASDFLGKDLGNRRIGVIIFNDKPMFSTEAYCAAEITGLTDDPDLVAAKIKGNFTTLVATKEAKEGQDINQALYLASRFNWNDDPTVKKMVFVFSDEEPHLNDISVDGTCESKYYIDYRVPCTALKGINANIFYIHTQIGAYDPRTVTNATYPQGLLGGCAADHFVSDRMAFEDQFVIDRFVYKFMLRNILDFDSINPYPTTTTTTPTTTTLSPEPTIGPGPGPGPEPGPEPGPYPEPTVVPPHTSSPKKQKIAIGAACAGAAVVLGGGALLMRRGSTPLDFGEENPEFDHEANNLEPDNREQYVENAFNEDHRDELFRRAAQQNERFHG